MKALGWILLVIGGGWALMGIGWFIGNYDSSNTQVMAIKLLAIMFGYVFPGGLLAGLGGILVAVAKRRARVVPVTLLLLLLASPALAEGERSQLLDQHGKRDGSAVVDQQTGRVELYDAKGRHEGFGVVKDGNRIEVFDQKGQRQGTIRSAPPSGEGRSPRR